MRGAMRVHVGLLAVQVAFATLPVAGKLVMEELPAFAFAWVRVLVGAAFFALLWFGRSASRIPLRDVAKIAGCGLLGMAANQVLFLGGLERTSAVHATVLVATIPVFAFLFALLGRREPASLLGALGVVVSFVGVLMLADLDRFELRSDSLVGDGMILANAAAYGVYLVAVKPFVERYGSLPIVAIGFGAAAVAVAPFGLPSIGSVLLLSPHAYALLAYVVAVPTIGAYLVNAWALGRAPASLVAVYIYLQPILGAALAVVVLGEKVGPRALLAAAAVFVGIGLVNRARLGPRKRP